MKPTSDVAGFGCDQTDPYIYILVCGLLVNGKDYIAYIMESHKNHVPNHQPIYVYICIYVYVCIYIYIYIYI